MSSPFPLNPENGDTYTTFGRTYEYSSLKSAWHPVSIAPKTSDIIGMDQFETPDVGDILVSDGTLFTKSTVNLPKIYPTIAELPLSGNIAGNIAVVSENNRVYIWNGAGWFSVALINTSPSITVGPNATYELNNDGTPTVITLAAVDPEEVPIAWTYSVTSGSLEDTTVTNDGSEFTITPGTVAATFDLTFTASDGINLAQTSASSFTLSFVPSWTSGGTLQSVLTTNVTNANLTTAAINDDGTVAVVGSSADSLATFRVYTRNGSTWTLAYTGSNISDRYAMNVSISGDGTTIAVSRGGDDRPGGNYGSFEIWSGSGSNWSLQNTVNYGAFSSYFGEYVQLSQDGTRILVGCLYDPRHMIVYQKSGSNWVLRGDTSSYTYGTYEYSQIPAGSSNLDVISCQIQDVLSGQRKFHIYEWNGTTYQLVVNISASGTYGNFGLANAVSPDGQYVVYRNNSSGGISGYKRDSALNWSVTGTELNDLSFDPARFKFSGNVGPGNFLLEFSNSPNTSPKVLTFSNGSWNISELEGAASFTFTGLQGSQTTNWGNISADGKHIVIVNTGENRTGYNNSGGVYFFKAN